MKLRVCIASWAPFVGGAEVAAERLALGLTDAGHDVFVLLGTKGEALQRMRVAGLRCEFVPMVLTDKWRWWRYTAARRELMRVFSREQPDLVHCNDLPTSQMVGEAALRLDIPRICHHRFPFDRAAINWLNKFGAERHLFVSRAFMQEMLARSAALASCESAVVHDGMPLLAAPTLPDRQAARTRLQLPQNKAIVLFAGQIVEHKGVADLISAWQFLSADAQHKSIFLIVGEDLQNNGKYRAEMESLARHTGCTAQFTGFQRNVADWQTAADIAVVPSRVEPLGLVVMEAMAQVLPVIGCDVGGIPEMLVHEETGLLVPSREPAKLAAAIERLVFEPDLRFQMGQAGRRRCERLFSLDVHVQNVLWQYEIVLGQRAMALTT